MAVKPGDILRDKFRIDALIGRGGMGQVFAATALDSSAREQVAIKVVSRLLVDDILMVRLHREAEAATRIRSEFVPRVLEVSDTEEGETFLVMERLVGEPLSQRIRDNGALPWSEVAKIGEDVLRALIDAHTAGIVHRDLKPSNVFLALKAGKVRAMVLDFGVCKMDGVDAERLTGTGESIGTVAYMAPEQIRGAARVDERADLFAFGVVVFEMLCGRLPHEGPSQMAILASKLENPPARLRDCTRVAIPAGLDELVGRSLARDPSQRFANAQDLLKAWRGLVKSSSMFPIAAGSTPPPRRSHPDSELTAGGDAPTEVLGAAKVTPAAGSAEDMADTDEDLAQEARRSYANAGDAESRGAANTTVDEDESESGRNFNLASAPPGAYGSFPPEPHPTQTSLTTHHTGIIRPGGRGARLALIGAAAGLALGVVVVGVSFSRPDSSVVKTPASSAPDESGSVAANAPTPEVSTTGPATSDSSEANASSFELPDNPPDSPPMTPGTKHPAARPIIRKRPPQPATRPASSKGITNQPRY